MTWNRIWWIIHVLVHLDLFLLNAFLYGAELQVPGTGKTVYDGDTFLVELPPSIMCLPAGVTIDGVEREYVEIPETLVNVRLVDNHIKGKTKGVNAPEMRTPSGRSEKGAKAARDRLRQLVQGKEGVLIINLDALSVKRSPQPNLARLLTMGRLLGDFRPNDRQSTAGETLFREGLVKEWRKQ
jgi:endonuclease YncB( thermonuclease family)